MRFGEQETLVVIVSVLLGIIAGVLAHNAYIGASVIVAVSSAGLYRIGSFDGKEDDSKNPSHSRRN